MNPEKINNNQEPMTLKHDENILVVKRDVLLQDGAWQGLKAVDFEKYLKIINEHKEFLPRSIMETDPSYKQIIPYLVFCTEDKFFLMQRKAKATESRLKSKYSLGIGGHIREEDLTSANIIEWAKREFEEEIDYNGNYTFEPIGILNDDSTLVGQVHIGFVFLLQGDSTSIKIKEEMESGTLLSLDECALYYDQMETWTQIVFNFLKK